MKPTRILTLASLAANAALLGYIVFHPATVAEALRTPSSASGYTHATSLSPGIAIPRSRPSFDSFQSALPATTVPPAPDAPPPETWSRLQSANLATFTANLRAAGLPERQVRMLVNAEINDRFRAREEALAPKSTTGNYWEKERDPTTLEQRLAQIDLRREKAALRRELLGDLPRDPNDKNPVPFEKRDLLRQVNEDYETMISQIQRESRGITLASDEEKIRYLRAEKAAELKTVLTPGELREYEIRSSPTANNLRSDLAAFGPSEQEFRAVFELRKQFEDQFPSQPAEPGPDYWKQRNEAQKAVEAQIAQQLGADRYRDYARAKDPEYRNLATLTDRVGLPQAMATQVYDLRYTVPADAVMIVRSKNLTPASKQESLKVIAQKTRAQITSQLGAEAAEAYLKRNGDWIKSLEHGQVIEFKSNGSQQIHQIGK